VEVICTDFYMDDLLTKRKTIEKVNDLKEELTELLELHIT